MKKRILSLIVVTLLSTLSPSFAQDVRTVTFGNGLWLEQGIQHNKTSTQTAVVFEDGLTFALTVALSDANVGSKSGESLGPKNALLWKSGNGSFTFSLKVTNAGTTSSLESLSFRSIEVNRLNQGGKSVRVSESASSRRRTLSGSQTIRAADLYDGGSESLTPLSKETQGTWDLTLNNMGSELAGIKSLAFDFTVGGDPWVTLSSEPTVYEDSIPTVTVTPNQTVRDLTADDFRVTNGTVQGLKELGNSYTLEIIPISTVGDFITVSLPGGVTTPSNQRSNTLQIEILDNTALVTLCHSSRPGDPDPTRVVATVNDDEQAKVLVNFSRPVKGLASSDFVINHGIITDLSGERDRYEVTVTPSGKKGDLIEVSLPANTVIPITPRNRTSRNNKASNALKTKVIDPTLFLDKVFSYDGVDSTTDEIEVIKDLVYGRGHTQGTANKTPLTLDIYRPIDDPNNPVLPEKLPVYVAIHGGGYVKGNKAAGHIRGYCEGLAQRGYIAVSIQYRLSNETVEPPNEDGLGPSRGAATVATRDAAKAIRWLRQNAEKYNIDTNRIIVGGNSAGGNATLVYGLANPGSPETARYQTERGEERLVQGAFKFREWEVFDFDTPVRLDVAVLHAQHGYLWSGDVSGITQPAILVHGTADHLVPVSVSQRISEAFEARGHPHTYLEAAGEGHGYFDYWDYINHEKNGKNYEELWVEFFFEHLNLAELLTDSPQSMEYSSQLTETGDRLKTSIKHDDRILYQLHKSTDRQNWTPVAETPVNKNGILEIETPHTDPKAFYRWDLEFDHQEITDSDYSR